MKARADISEYLIHFTKGDDANDAFSNLLSIINELVLYGGSGMIKGGYKCVCFSEAPLEAVANGLVNEAYYSKYSPFGIMVSKKWLFQKGGRPVIYQTEEEFLELTSNKWRHVTFNPSVENPIDFTWEREWRVHTDRLELEENECTIIVPNHYWAEQIAECFGWVNGYSREELNLIFNDDLIVEQYLSQNSFYYRIPVISLP